MGRREGLHGAMKTAGNGMAPVSYSISRLARSTRDMLELASPSAGGPADRKDITTVNFKYLLSLGCAVAAPLVASGSRSEARRFFPRRGPRSNQWYQAKRNGDGIVRWDAQCAHLAPNWLRNAQLCGRPLVKCVASTDTGLACAATQYTEGPHDSDASSQSSLEDAYR